MSQSLVWLITGTSSGIGRQLALAALRRGDKVIATARQKSLGRLDELKAAGADVLELDVTASPEMFVSTAERAFAIHGRIDVLVNNAGAYLACGAFEEISADDTTAHWDVNFFGALNLTRAFLPHMRKQKSGYILWIGSLHGWRAGVSISMYASVKHAMRGISESLDLEIAPLGLRSINIEPGYYRSKLADEGNRKMYKNIIPDYKAIVMPVDDMLHDFEKRAIPGDPAKLSEIIVDLVRHEGTAKVKADLTERLAVLEEWKNVITTTNS